MTEGEVIAIDGKCLRSSLDKVSQKAAIHLVSAWAQQNSLVLGKVKVNAKSKEITAIPKLLERLDISSAIISIDAMGCQKKIAGQIVRQGGDYVLSLKGNQGTLLDDVDTFFRSALAPPAALVCVDGDYGCLETRTIRAIDDIAWLRERHDWAGLKSIIAVTLQRESNPKDAAKKRAISSAAWTPAIHNAWRVRHAPTGPSKITCAGCWDVAFDESHPQRS